MYNLLHRLALFVRRSDDLWPAKAQWCQKVGARVHAMDQRGRVDWTTVWRKKMQEQGCTNVPVFDRSEWLASRVRALKPSVWMDASTFAQGVWKDISGNNNHLTETQGVQLMRQEAGPDGVGQAFLYLGGGKDAGLRISKGWPSGRDHTSAHITKPTAPRSRIWNRVDNCSPGHHGDRGGRAHHNAWLTTNPKFRDMDSNWLMTVDQKRSVRFNAGKLTASTGTGFSPSAVGINALAGRYIAPTAWPSMPIKMSSAPNMCMDVSGVAKSNGTKVHSWSCNNAANQSWSYQPGTGQLTDANSGKCLDLPGGNDANGTQLQIYDCNGTNNNQKWEVMDSGVLKKPVPTSVSKSAAAQRPTAPRSSCGIVTWGRTKSG
jgi:hypothetical protein